MIYLETLLYITRGNEVLLIKKKRGLGAGLYNGVGGKVKVGEAPENAAVRECIEEIGIEPMGIKRGGLLEFWNYEDGAIESIHYVYIFTASGYRGEPRETKEAIPLWFKIEELPYDLMWEDDRYWLPHVLKGRGVYGRFIFDKWRLKNWSLYLLQETR